MRGNSISYGYLLMIVTLLSACSESLEPGTAKAASLMATEIVEKIYYNDSVGVSTNPLVEGDAAYVKAQYIGQIENNKDHICYLEFVKHPTANKYGWVVRAILCGKNDVVDGKR